MDKLNNPQFTFPPFWKAAVRIQLDSLAFMTRRTQAYLDLSKALSKCKSPESLMAEQVRFWEQAQRQYLQQFESALSAIPLPSDTKASAPSQLPTRSRDYMTMAKAKDALSSPNAPSPKEAPQETPARTTAPALRRTA